MKQRIRWVPTVTLMPFVYLVGWLSTRILLGAFPCIDSVHSSLGETLLSFVIFLLLLPSWVRTRWGKSSTWKALGVFCSSKIKAGQGFVKGLLLALVLVFLVVALALLESSATWVGELTNSQLLNAVLLALGVGFAEELVFRGWLLEELINLFGFGRGFVAQALIFSLVHVRLGQDFFDLLFLSVGLFLLGLVLGVMRIVDGGSLWSCVGLHGGLVGIWFAVNSGLIEISAEAPAWIVGPGGYSPNPLGGLISIALLVLLLWSQWIALARAARP